MPDVRIRITDSQFENFTGLMFRTSFTNSVSDYPVPEHVQETIFATLQAEVYEGDVQQPEPEPQPVEPQPEPQPVEQTTE